MNDKVIEVMAQGICESQGEDMAVFGLQDHKRETYTEAASFALAALDSAGFAVVPKEPSEAMIEIGDEMIECNFARTNDLAGPAYKSMLSAARSPQSNGQAKR